MLGPITESIDHADTSLSHPFIHPWLLPRCPAWSFPPCPLSLPLCPCLGHYPWSLHPCPCLGHCLFAPGHCIHALAFVIASGNCFCALALLLHPWPLCVPLPWSLPSSPWHLPWLLPRCSMLSILAPGYCIHVPGHCLRDPALVIASLPHAIASMPLSLPMCPGAPYVMQKYLALIIQEPYTMYHVCWMSGFYLHILSVNK